MRTRNQRQLPDISSSDSVHDSVNESPSNSPRRPIQEYFNQSDNEGEDPFNHSSKGAPEGIYDFERLKNEILKWSQAEDWKKARKEWVFIYLFQLPEGKCLCGHSPITNHCVIKNQINENELVVGMVCVKKFGEGEDIRMNTIFGSYNRLLGDLSYRANEQLISHAFKMNFLTTNEREIYENLPNRKKRSQNEEDRLRKINSNMIEKWNAKIFFDCKMCKFPAMKFHYKEINGMNAKEGEITDKLYYVCEICDYECTFKEPKKKSPKNKNLFLSQKKVPKKKATNHEEEDLDDFYDSDDLDDSESGEEKIPSFILRSALKKEDQDPLGKANYFTPQMNGIENSNSFASKYTYDEDGERTYDPDL